MDSIYLHLWYINPLQKFKDFVIDNNLSATVQDILIGSTIGKYIYRKGFTKTIDNGILIEIPYHSDLIIWRTKLINYLNNHPELMKVEILTKEEAWLKIPEEV